MAKRSSSGRTDMPISLFSSHEAKKTDNKSKQNNLDFIDFARFNLLVLHRKIDCTKVRNFRQSGKEEKVFSFF